MMNEEIKQIIEELPRYICYLYPGYISMYLFYYFQALTLQDTKAKAIKSIAISYIYILVVDKIVGLFNTIPGVLDIKKVLKGLALIFY